MGVRQIWDGKDLPPVGSEVLIKLASQKEPYPMQVLGHTADWSAEMRAFRINVQLAASDGTTNMRSLQDVYPMDWRGEMPVGHAGRFKHVGE